MTRKIDINDSEMSEKEEILSDKEETAENVTASSEAALDPEGENDAPGEGQLQTELAEQKDKFIRLYSEFENFRRRTSKEKLDLIQSANEQLLKMLLPVADDFERAEKAFKDKSDKDLEGFLLISNKFKKTLEQAGVKVMDIKAGSDFNADLHEAITQVPVENEALKGKIVDVVENGYLLNDKVIRYAKVVVGS